MSTDYKTTYEKARIEAGLSLTQASSILSINKTRLRNIEAGAIRPDEQEAMKLAQTYSVSIDWLKGELNPKTLEKLYIAASLDPDEKTELEDIINSMRTD